MDLPNESLFFQPIIVDRPLSWMVYVIGAPVRARFSRCSESKARHSGPWSMNASSSTRPQVSQTISPRPWSIWRCCDPHSGQVVVSSMRWLFFFWSAAVDGVMGVLADCKRGPAAPAWGWRLGEGEEGKAGWRSRGRADRTPAAGLQDDVDVEPQIGRAHV